MGVTARVNGWRGFDGIGERVDGGWLYRCDGMPHPMGCVDEITLTRRITKVGAKSSGWLVTYGHDEGPGDDGKGNDTDVVLVFCPACAPHIEQDGTCRQCGGRIGQGRLCNRRKCYDADTEALHDATSY